MAPFTSLRPSVDTKNVMALDFLDVLIPRAIYREFRFADFGALAATMAFLIASFFTTLSASLFGTHSLAVTGSVILSVNQSFDVFVSAISDNFALPAASLILESNLSYPQFTYGDMAFLELLPPSLPSQSDLELHPSSLVMQAIVPAVRGKMECREYYSSSIRLNHTVGYAESGINDPLGVWIDAESCSRNPSSNSGRLRHEAYISTYPNMTYFGVSKESSFYTDDFDIQDGCSDLLYICSHPPTHPLVQTSHTNSTSGGKMDDTADSKIQHVSALGCNVTFEAVDVNTTFLNAVLDIDPAHPPIPINDTIRPAAIERLSSRSGLNAQTQIYHYLVEMPSGTNNLNTFFQVLTTSRCKHPPAPYPSVPFHLTQCHTNTNKP